MSESIQSATPSSNQQSPVKEDAPTITNALSKRFDLNFVASTFITGVAGVDRHKFKGKWSWIYMACISSTFIVVCATLLWNSLFESCSLQSSSFDAYFTDSEIAGIVLKDGVRYCFSEFIKDEDDTYLGSDTYYCSIGVKSDADYCADYTTASIDNARSCYQSTEGDELILVYFMSCTTTDVALNTAISFALYSCIFVTYLYFFVRILKKKLSIWSWESWKQVMYNADYEVTSEMHVTGEPTASSEDVPASQDISANGGQRSLVAMGNSKSENV